jgi:hypothetical protein
MAGHAAWHGRWDGFLSGVFGMCFTLVAIVCALIRTELAVLSAERRLRVRNRQPADLSRALCPRRDVRIVRLTLLSHALPAKLDIELVSRPRGPRLPAHPIPAAGSVCAWRLTMGVRLVKVLRRVVRAVAERASEIHDVVGQVSAPEPGRCLRSADFATRFSRPLAIRLPLLVQRESGADLIEEFGVSDPLGGGGGAAGGFRGSGKVAGLGVTRPQACRAPAEARPGAGGSSLSASANRTAAGAVAELRHSSWSPSIPREVVPRGRMGVEFDRAPAAGDPRRRRRRPATPINPSWKYGRALVGRGSHDG